jgi:hypothetical protein
MCLRITPIDTSFPSPAELLFGRKIHANLPAKEQVTREKQEIHDRMVTKSEQSSMQYDRNAGIELPELLPGMKVMIQDPGKTTWKPGTIREKCPEPRSYIVETPNGGTYRRNRRFLKELGPTACKKLEQEYGTTTDPPNRVPESTEKMPGTPRHVSFQLEPQVVHDEPMTRPRRNVHKPTRLIEEC